MSNNKQSSVEQLIKMIDFEISMLEMDAGNHVEWSMAVMFGTLKKIKKKAEQAKAMHKEEIIEAWDNAAIDATYGNKFSSPEQYYNETYGGNNE